MKISGFTFLRNAVELGFPFVESIQSLLPLVDEYVIAVGESRDDTLQRIKSISSTKIKVIETEWNEKMSDRGFVYAQQKMIAQYLCTGDWTFYLEGDEVLHEDDIAAIRSSLEKHHHNANVEALVFDYLHFYGSPDWIAISPEWYRRECRIIRNTIRTFAPDGQYWLVMQKNRKGRHPRAALANARIFHYGHTRKIDFLQRKVNQVSKYWGGEPPQMRYDKDPKSLKQFTGTHPRVLGDWLTKHAGKDFLPNYNHRLTKRERKHRVAMMIERVFGVDLSRKHYKLIN